MRMKFMCIMLALDVGMVSGCDRLCTVLVLVFEFK